MIEIGPNLAKLLGGVASIVAVLTLAWITYKARFK
jgi:hypothetical protein